MIVFGDLTAIMNDPDHTATRLSRRCGKSRYTTHAA
jgi:hypothetical protein